MEDTYVSTEIFLTSKNHLCGTPSRICTRQSQLIRKNEAWYLFLSCGWVCARHLLKKNKNHFETAFEVEKRGSGRRETGSNFDSESRGCPGWNLMVKYLVAFLPINFGQLWELDDFITNKSLLMSFGIHLKITISFSTQQYFRIGKRMEGGITISWIWLYILGCNHILVFWKEILESQNG